MKRGDEIKVTFNTPQPIRSCKWTEELTNEKTAHAGSVFYHKCYGKLFSFYPTITCFYTEKHLSGGYWYRIELLESAEVSYFGDDEVRLDLSEVKCRITYLGKVIQSDSFEEYRIGNSCYRKYSYKDHRIDD